MQSNRERYFRTLIDELIYDTLPDSDRRFGMEYNTAHNALQNFNAPFEHMAMKLPSVQATDSHKNSLLHYAAAYGDPSNVVYVLSKPMNGPQVNAINSDGYTALQLLVMKLTLVDGEDRKKCHESLRLLLEAGADPRLPHITENGLVRAAMLYCPVTMNMLYCNMVQKEPCKIKLMQWFKNADWTLLHFMWTGDVELTKQFIDSDRSIFSRYEGSNFALHLAVEARAPAAFFELFVSYNLDPNYCHPSTGDTPLHRLCELADEWLDFDVLEKLLELGANPNLTNRKGQNCLHLAAVVGSDLVVRWLLKHNVETDTYDLEGKNAMHYAAISGSKVVIATLHDTGLSALDRCRSDDGPSALHLASYYCHPEVVAYLITLGLNPNELDCKGLTPMHYAVRREDINLVHRRTETVDTLVQYGAYLFYANCGKESPFSYCLRRKFLSNSSIIIRYFARRQPRHSASSQFNAFIMSKITKNQILKEAYDNCLAEIQAMKEYEVFGWVSIHTIFIAPLKVIRPLMRNSDVVRGMYRCIIDRVVDEKFPIYGKQIIQRFSRYEEEQSRISFACEGLSDLLGHWDPSGIIAENVVKFLGEDIDALVQHRQDIALKNMLKFRNADN